MILALALTALVAQTPEQTLRRFALVAGANDGGNSRVTLRYAASDARAMSRVLTQLGGVAPGDVTVVEDPSPRQLERALDELSQKLAAARASQQRVEVFFYYSGHSDEEGLLLQGDRVKYSALRARLEALPAEVRIAVLDSCASGALTLAKGGAPRPSFLVDASSSLSGHAFLTSASADEAAQESERLKASIFTHYFLSGLRGAADTNRDGRITLAEAYQYAFSETLARTTSTRAGPQRPGWDIQLVGTGDLVLTDVRASDARLVLDSTIGGRVFVRGASGGLVVEVAKAAGKPIELGLESGDYKVVVDDGAGHVGEAKVSLASQSSRTLAQSEFIGTTLEKTVLRGDDPKELPRLPFDVSLVPPLGITSVMSQPPRVNFTLGIIGTRVGAIEGLGIGSVFTWVDRHASGVSVSGAFTRVGTQNGLGVSGALLLSMGESRGVSIAPVMVHLGDTYGLEAGAVSVVKGDFTGVQASAVNIVTGRARGPQFSTVNIVGGSFGGAQFGTVNGAFGDVTGGQFGLLNIGGDVVGTQIGLLNIAKSVKGLQLGLLNIAQESSAPVGLLNIITRGKLRLAAWGSETNAVNLALKVGGSHVYSFLVAGVNPRVVETNPHFSYGLGLGVHVTSGRWFGEIEGSFEDVHRFGGRAFESQAFDVTARVNIGFQIAEKFGVFAGPQLHTHIAMATEDVRVLSSIGVDLSSRVRLVPGIVVGLQVF